MTYKGQIRAVNYINKEGEAERHTIEQYDGKKWREIAILFRSIKEKTDEA